MSHGLGKVFKDPVVDITLDSSGFYLKSLVKMGRICVVPMSAKSRVDMGSSLIMNCNSAYIY